MKALIAAVVLAALAGIARRAGADAIRRGRSPSSCRSRRAARPARWRASCSSRCRRRSASRSSSRTSAAPAAAIGAGRVARAAPDGYTISFSHMQTHVLNGAVLNLPYDVVTDFEPVALIADTPQIIVTRTAFPANDLKELIAWLKANPDKGTSGAVGIGGPSDISALQFQQHDRHQLPVGAVSRRRAAAGGLGRRPDRHQFRPGLDLHRRRAQRPAQGAGHAGQGALVGRARGSDRR